MPYQDKITLPNGKTWWVGSYCLFREISASRAHVIVPAEGIDGMTNEEIGFYVREAMPFALECAEDEESYVRRGMDEDAPREPRLPAPQRKASDAGYIYLIVSRHGYKIGKTKSIPDRMNFFGVKLPFKTELVHSIPTNDMTKAENKLHRRFADKQLEGEWFDLSEKDVRWICSLKTL